MANERTYPCLPCADVDGSVAFYEALGFKRTYRQVRPNPYAVVALEEIHIHLFGIEGFDPAQSYGTVIVVVPDPDRLYRDFAAGLREMFGKLPVAGIPRITRPRKKYGTVRGFSVVDLGGNWLRISKLGETEEEDSAEKAEGLAGIVYVAAPGRCPRGRSARAQDARKRPDAFWRGRPADRIGARASLSSGAGRSDRGPRIGSIVTGSGRGTWTLRR